MGKLTSLRPRRPGLFIDESSANETNLSHITEALEKLLDERFKLLDERFDGFWEKFWDNFATMQQQQQSKVIYVNSLTEKVVPEKEFIINKLFKLLSELKEKYEDDLDRLEILCLIKENIKKLKNITNKEENKYYYRSCIILHDAILHIKSEYLTLQQINAIEAVVFKLSQESIDKDEFYEIDTILYKNGLDCIPDLRDEESDLRDEESDLEDEESNLGDEE